MLLFLSSYDSSYYYHMLTILIIDFMLNIILILINMACVFLLFTTMFTVLVHTIMYWG